jgi:hypothetical protein
MLNASCMSNKEWIIITLVNTNLTPKNNKLDSSNGMISYNLEHKI